MLNSFMGQAIYILAFLAGTLAGELVSALIVSITRKNPYPEPQPSCGKCGAFRGSFVHPGIIGFIHNKGKCPNCGALEKIKPLVIEAICGLLFTMFLYRYSVSIELFVSFFIICAMIIIFYYGTSNKIVPDRILLWLLGIGLITAIYTRFKPVSYLFDRKWWNQPTGFISAAVFLLILAVLGSFMPGKEPAFSMGDIKLFSVIGFCIGWRLTIVAIFISIIMAGVIGGGLLFAGGKEGSRTFPFSPFIAFSTLIVLYAGQDLVFWLAGII